MKRVLFILPNLDLGGMEIVVMNYFRHIRGIVFDFVVHGESGYFEDEAASLGARIFRVPTRKQSFFGSIAEMHRIYKQHKEYDTVVVCTEHSFAFIELCVAWFAGVKTRGAWSHFSDYQGRSKVKRWANFAARPLLRLFTNMYLACTKDAGRWLFGNAGLRKRNFHIVNNAIDMNKFAFCPETRERFRKKLGLDGKFAIGIAGRLSPVKNHAFALEAFREVCHRDNSAVLLVIGDGELKADIMAHAARLGNVLFTGAVDDIHNYYQALDVLIVPSFHEGFPMIVIEAQGVGLNVLMSDTISQEVAVSELARFKSLQAGANAWATALLELKGFKREAVDLTASGFHIVTEVEKLQEILEGGSKR